MFNLIQDVVDGFGASESYMVHAMYNRHLQPCITGQYTEQPHPGSHFPVHSNPCQAENLHLYNDLLS